MLYYWQPNAVLRKAGHVARRLAAQTNDYDQACAEADAINEQLDKDRAADAGPVSRRRDIAGLIAEFEKDRRYLTKTKKTRDGYDQCMRIIAKRFGDVPVAAVTRSMLEKFYNKMYPRTPWQANAVMRMFNRLLHVAWTYNWVPTNVGAKMELVGCDPRDEVWEAAEVDYFCRMAIWLGYPSMGLAVKLGEEIGQREGDILALRWTQYLKGKIRLRQSKGGKWVEVEPTSELRVLLDAADPRQQQDGPRRVSTHMVVSEATGQPYKGDWFRHLFAKIRDCAELGKLHYQDLRRTCVVNLARAGATPPEIAAITGHEIDRVVKILEVYLPRDSIMAEHAIVKLEAWKRERGRAPADNSTEKQAENG
jgi:integrase